MATITHTHYIYANNFRKELRNNDNWLLIAGISLVMLSIFAISALTLSSTISVNFLSLLLASSGGIILFHAFKFWRYKWLGFALHILAGMMYITVGFMLSNNFFTGTITLSLLLAVSYFVIGLFRIYLAVTQRYTHLGWGWTLISGIVNLLLGLFIGFLWPTLRLWDVGLVSAIDILFAGFAILMLGVNVKRKLMI